MTRTHCSFCGDPVPEGALACPSCGSDRETGWADEEDLRDAAFAPFTDEDYDVVIAGLPGVEADGPRSVRDRILVLIVVLILAAFVVAYVI